MRAASRKRALLLIPLSVYVPIMPDADLIELTEAEIAFALEIILRADSHAIPVLKGKGSPRDCNVRDAAMRAFAKHLACHLRQHMRCFRGTGERLHSAG